MSRTLEHIILRRAIEMIQESWTRDTRARDNQGRPICPKSARAVSFCAQGAMVRVAHELGLDVAARYQYDEFFQALADQNDRFGREAVIEIMERRLKEL